MPNKPKIEQTSNSVITVRFDDISSGWEYWVLLRSDAHHDSPYCNRKLEKKHLEMAKERDALIMDGGDTFDAMQGKFDPRRTLEDVRPEDKVADYYGAIARHAAEDYAPYADNFVLFGKGNHETAVLDKANTCLITSLVDKLNAKRNDEWLISPGGFGGWVRFAFLANKTKRSSINMKYNHDGGGNAPVTRGAIKTNRQAVFLPDADIVWNGHNHQGYTIPIAKERLTPRGAVSRSVSWFLRTPGYKDEYGDGSSGYAVRMNSGPTPLGSIWLHFTFLYDKVSVKPIMEIE